MGSGVILRFIKSHYATVVLPLIIGVALLYIEHRFISPDEPSSAHETLAEGASSLMQPVESRIFARPQSNEARPSVGDNLKKIKAIPFGNEREHALKSFITDSVQRGLFSVALEAAFEIKNVNSRDFALEEIGRAAADKGEFRYSDAAAEKVSAQWLREGLYRYITSRRISASQ